MRLIPLCDLPIIVKNSDRNFFLALDYLKFIFKIQDLYFILLTKGSILCKVNTSVYITFDELSILVFRFHNQILNIILPDCLITSSPLGLAFC